LNEQEKTYDKKGEVAPSIMLIRWRIVYFKLNKLLGTYTSLEKTEKLGLVNTIMQTYLWAEHKHQELTDVDKHNLDDIIIVAAELLYEIKVYEWSVLNPINFMLIAIVEYAIKKSPNNNSLRVQLLKAYDKLGLTSKFTGVSSNVKGLEDEQFVKFGALKYSHYQEYGTNKELDLTCQRYEKYFSEAQAKNKSELVNGFKNREFQGLNDLITKNDRLEKSFFLNVVKMSKLHMDINFTSTNLPAVQKLINKQATFLNQIADDDKVPSMSKKNVDSRNFHAITLGLSREQVKEEECI